MSTPKVLETTKESGDLHSAFPSVVSSTSSVFKNVCLFCGKNKLSRRRYNKESLGSCETDEAEQSICMAAKIKTASGCSEGKRILTQIAGVEFVSKKVKYHHSCKSSFMKSAERIRNTQKLHKPSEPQALKAMISYVTDKVIEGNRPELLKSIYQQYCEYCEEVDEIPVSTAQSLGDILVCRIGSKIQLNSPKSKKLGVVVHHCDFPADAIRAAFDFGSSDESIVIRTALILRKALKCVKHSKMPCNLTTDCLFKDEGSPPDIATEFFKVLYGGLNESNYTADILRRADSSSQDSLFIVSKRLVKPKKHLMLGLGVKSLTGSRKLLTILNRFGHTVNYHCAEELETELALAQQQTGLICPEGTQKNCVMGLAFDNYDELTHPLSGAESLHDTMGILYQVDLPSETVIGESSTTSEKTLASKQSRKRTLPLTDTPLDPYQKRPQMCAFSHRLTQVTTSRHTSELKKDQIWTMCHALQLENIPMWAVFNSQSFIDTAPKQVVLYMPNLNQPPTSLAVVMETLHITQQC